MSFGVRLRVKTIKMSTWVKRGHMLVNRQALDSQDPDLPYNWIMRTFEGRVDPRDFGFEKPRFARELVWWQQ